MFLKLLLHCETENGFMCYVLFTRQRALRTPQRQKVRDGFEITTTDPLQVQKSKPGSAEQVQGEQVSFPGGEERPQSVCGQEKTRPWPGTVWQQGLQRWLSWPASASAQGPSRFQERLGGRQEARTTTTREQCERSIIKVNIFTG